MNMFTDSHCHIEDDATAFRAGEAGVGVILNAGKDLDEAAAQLLCASGGQSRAAQSAAGQGRTGRRCGRAERHRSRMRGRHRGRRRGRRQRRE